MKLLSPPLQVIEDSLFSPSPDLLLRLAQAPDTVPAVLRDAVLQDTRQADLVEALRQDATVDLAAEAPPMPRWLRERIAQRVQARAARFSETPTAGQIRAIKRVVGPQGPLDWDLPRPLAVCLDSPYSGHRDIWYGWLVSPETDYASYWDILLEEDDGPRDPLAGMIQLWNPTYCYLPSTGRVLAQLAPERLAALRAAAAEFLGGDVPTLAPRPGHVAVRNTLGGHTVVTGTPLGDSDDPRWRYRTLYQAALAALREPVTQALDAARERARQPGLLERLQTQLQDWLGALWIPGSALAHAMGGGDNGAVLEGEIAGRLRLRAEAEEGGLVLVIRLLGNEPLCLKVVSHGEELAEYRLDLQHTTQTLDIDAEQDYSLRLLSIEGGEIAHFDWSAHPR